MRNLVAIIAICLLAPLSAFGAEVTRLDKSGLINLKLINRNQWRINDHLCIVQKKKTLACGQVIRANLQGLVVQLTIEILAITDNTEVGMIRINPTERVLAGILGIEEHHLHQPTDRTHLAVGTTTVLAFWPYIHFEQAFTNHIAVGLMPSYFSISVGNGTMKGFELLTTLSYYQHSPYKGLWVLLGAGFDVFSAETPGGNLGAVSVSGMGLVGWKFLFPSDITLGLGVGGHYFLNHEIFTFSHPGFVTNFMMQVGVIF